MLFGNGAHIIHI